MGCSLYHGACVSVFNKKSKLIYKIELQAKNITNCTFGGKIIQKFLLHQLQKV